MFLIFYLVNDAGGRSKYASDGREVKSEKSKVESGGK
jgi:hypothetical protein